MKRDKGQRARLAAAIGANLTKAMEETNGEVDCPTLARKALLERSIISDILHGRTVPSLETLYRIASALGISIRRLVPEL
jgi:transcriptional regulator with XRE-family HTH domain